MHSYYGCLEAPLSEDLDSEESIHHRPSRRQQIRGILVVGSAGRVGP
jgi:hypothetical protein